MIENTFKTSLSQICQPQDKILVTVSGGKDSMALLDLLRKTPHYIEVAHVNFKLRGEESDLDENLVKEYCKKHEIIFHVNSFETKKYAKENAISTQMAARELRYKWFYELLEKQNLDWIATAHHLNDNIETLLLNITKGTGPKGLAGIPKKVEKVIRPLLKVSSEEIKNYMIENQIIWREDLSNQENKYQRNKIRNQVIPDLKSINQGLEKTVSVNLERFQDLNEIFNFSLDLFKLNLIQEGNLVKIPNNLMQEMPGIILILEEFLKDFGFTRTQISDLFESKESGKSIYANDYQILKDRAFWILSLKQEKSDLYFEINDFGNYNFEGFSIEITEVQEANFGLKNEIYLDSKNISWPLILRNPNEADRFMPFGMKGSKLVSDFLKDEKLNTIDKQKQLLLVNQNEILWIVGRRTSEKTRVSNKTAGLIRIKIQKIL